MDAYLIDKHHKRLDSVGMHICDVEELSKKFSEFNEGLVHDEILYCFDNHSDITV